MTSSVKILGVALAAVLATGTIAVLSEQSSHADHGDLEKGTIWGDLTSTAG